MDMWSGKNTTTVVSLALIPTTCEQYAGSGFGAFAPSRASGCNSSGRDEI